MTNEKSLTQQAYDDLYQQYIYVYGVLAIMVENEGGVVKLDRELLENYDLTIPMTIRHDSEDDTYVIEVTPA